MSYTTIHTCANDASFIARVQACAAQEGAEDPEWAAMMKLRWPIAAKTDIEAAYEYALNSGNPDPGGDPGVITDGMILAAAQSVLTPEPPPVGQQ